MSGRVATTQWSQVLAARDGSDTEARAALESLCQTYWQPLYAYIRHQGSDPDEARDLTQGYFTELIEKDFLAGIDPEKGRFRSFLLASLRNFLSHQRDRAHALKRGGGAVTLSLDTSLGERGYDITASNEMTPEALYEYRRAGAGSGFSGRHRAQYHQPSAPSAGLLWRWSPDPSRHRDHDRAGPRQCMGDRALARIPL